MALSVGARIELTVQQVFMGQTIANVWGYEITSIPITVNAVQVAEAWWNHVKGAYRASMPGGYGTVFRSVKLREMNDPAGDYAEFDIPVAEQSGTRSASGDQMPPYAAVGVRLVVGTRVTRPGQKRFAGLQEGDQSAGVLIPGTITLFQAIANSAGNNITLGAPAATTALVPQIFRKDANGIVVASQAVTGNIVNPNVSTQNSRKFGRGS